MSAVFDLQLTTDRHLVAGTHGYSMWKYALGDLPPDAPLNLTINSDGAIVVLRWSPSQGATSYQVYGSATPDSGGELLVTTTLTSWTDPNFASRPSTYFYYVTAE